MTIDEKLSSEMKAFHARVQETARFLAEKYIEIREEVEPFSNEEVRERALELLTLQMTRAGGHAMLQQLHNVAAIDDFLRENPEVVKKVRSQVMESVFENSEKM